MTHSGGKPHKVGDEGQRYEVRSTGYPKKAESVIGWCPELEGAERMAQAIRKAPGCTSTVIWDREEEHAVKTTYTGAAR